MAALGSVRQEVRTIRRRKRNEGSQKRYCGRKTNRKRTTPATHVRVPDAISAISKCTKEGRDYLSLKLDNQLTARQFSQRVGETDNEDHF
jgi:uncharacterized protein (DUF736 family)